MINKIDDIVRSISSFIVSWLHCKENFECRSFYGEAYTLALLDKVNLLDGTTKQKLIIAYRSIDKFDSQFHWEFNNYALLHYVMNSADESVRDLYEPLRFKNTPCTNWTLLRSNVRLLANVDKNLAIKEAKAKLDAYQLHSGLILDDPGVKSFQYHCFSMAMVAEIYDKTDDTFFLEGFLKGVHFIRSFILSNGESLYVGRGQNQSFGYAALLYILVLSYRYTFDKTILGDIERVLGFIVRYQREDGSFPLVLGNLEEEIPTIVDMKDPRFAGWYPYNNYFDYLPFMGFFLAKAFDVLAGLHISEVSSKTQVAYRDHDFIKIVKDRYEAVLSRPGGYWSNDLPIPYVVAGGKNLTPCYGGEQFQYSLYNLKGIPLPFCDLLQKSIRWRSWSFFLKNTLWIISPLGVMKRRFEFNEDCIQINTMVISPFKFEHLYHVIESNEGVYENLSELDFRGYSYSANGRLLMFVDNKQRSSLRIKIES